MRHITLRTRFNQGVSVGNWLIGNLFKFNNPALETFENFGSFFCDICELSVRQEGHICNKDFSVIFEG